MRHRLLLQPHDQLLLWKDKVTCILQFWQDIVDVRVCVAATREFIAPRGLDSCEPVKFASYHSRVDLCAAYVRLLSLVIQINIG